MTELADALDAKYGHGPGSLIRAGLEVAAGALAAALPVVPSLNNARETFIEWTKRVRPAFVWYKHNLIVGQRLQDVFEGRISRLIIEEPPRHGKSEQLSRLFSAYWLDKRPDQWVGLNTYAAELSETLSADAQENFQRAGGIVHPKHKGVVHWRTVLGGGMWCAGIGGPIGGKGFHLGIIDDPIKNAMESLSQAIGRRNTQWYQSTFYPRQEPNAAIVIATTRWPGPGDLVGWLFDEEGSEEDEPEHWHVVSLEALYEGEAAHEKLPATCVREPDWRTELEQPLCPERHSFERLRKTRKRIGPYWWASLYQQRPTPLEGAIFKRAWYQIVPLDRVPRGKQKDVRYWDTASTEGGGDYTVGTRMREGTDGLYYIVHVVRGQWAPDERKRIIKQVVQLDGAGVIQWGQQEPGSAGVDARMDFQQLLKGYEVYVEPVTGSKEVRGGPFAAASAGGWVRLVEGDWNKAWLDEIITLWEGAKTDDQGETAAGAYTKLALPRDSRDLDPMGWGRILKG